MYDDELPPDLYESDDLDDEQSPRRLSGRGCLFLVVTVFLIASLVGSTILTYFVITRNERRTGTGQFVVESGPTAAPATVVAAVATALPTIEANDPQFIPQINRIAIINDEGQVETLSPDGGDRRVLTLASDNTLFQFPAWAPDGRRVAIIGNRTIGGGIYVLDDTDRTGTLVEKQIYFSADETPVYLYWSPDSATLAFLANHSRNSLGLNVVAGDGATASRLLATGAPFYWDWSDDGRQLLIHSGQARSDSTLALLNLDGNTQADNLANPGDFQAPGIGQGGRFWAFAEVAESGLSSLVVVDTQTGERTAHIEVGSLALGWSPTRNQVAYTRGAVNDHPYWGPLHVLDATSGEQRLLTTQTVLAFFWSPDGRQIAFVTLSERGDDDSINVSAPLKNRPNSSRLDRLPAAQFGQGFLTLSVVDVETGQGLRLLDFEPTRAYLSQFLPYFDQYALSHRVWSPDSSALVLPVREEGRNVILIIPTQGGRPHRLAQGEIAFWSYQ